MSKQKFSSFTFDTALEKLGVNHLVEWKIDAPSVAPSDFFHEHMRRLKVFDLVRSEGARILLIDAIFAEVLQSFPALKIFKETALVGENTTGIVDYLVSPNRDYPTTPFLCVAEAKKDDFAKGLAQCLVEMEACQWRNAQKNISTDVFGIVSNGQNWQLYKLTMTNEVYQTLPYSIREPEEVLGVLKYIFALCNANILA
jgi:hypothetical protein